MVLITHYPTEMFMFNILINPTVLTDYALHISEVNIFFSDINNNFMNFLLCICSGY